MHRHPNTPPLGTSGVYTITNMVDSKQYVGSSQDIQLRWQQHRTQLRTNSHHSHYLQRAWNKYGEDAFIFQMIEKTPPDRCVEREQYWINTLNPAYNLLPTAGSPRGYRASESTRAKLSAVAKTRNPPMLGKHHTEMTRTKIAQTRKERGIPAPSKGEALSEERKAKLRAAKLGKPLSPEHRAAISQGLAGRKMPSDFGEQIRQRQLGTKHAPERREKNSVSHLGQSAWNKGVPNSDEAKDKMKAAWARRRGDQPTWDEKRRQKWEQGKTERARRKQERERMKQEQWEQLPEHEKRRRENIKAAWTKRKEKMKEA